MGDRRVIHLVDDEESIRKAASFALKTAGYDVVTYASGVEFLKEAKSAAVGCVILDVCAVTIGDKTQIGPGVQILAADHPRDPAVRAQMLEFGRPVTIGRNVWIGGGAILLPGVTVGDDALIGAGSVVTRDVPAGATVVGNPARVR